MIVFAMGMIVAVLGSTGKEGRRESLNRQP